jgi:hypothetical protein
MNESHSYHRNASLAGTLHTEIESQNRLALIASLLEADFFHPFSLLASGGWDVFFLPV